MPSNAIRRSAIGARALLPTLLLVLLSLSVSATSILQLSFEDLVAKSELVFEGRVIASKASWNSVGTNITTEVQFVVNEVIKGEFSDKTLSLSFAGGQVGVDETHIQAMVYPQVGEQGIYFVERTGTQMVNPLLGWSQGHFLIENGRVNTNQNKRVMAINSVSQQQRREFSLSSGEAKGLQSKKIDAQTDTTGLTVAQFKQLIKQF